MRALVLTSDSQRHSYFAQTVASYFNLLGVVKEGKGDYYGSNKDVSALVRAHFDALSKAEKVFFGDASWPPVPTVEVNKGGINDEDLIAWGIDLSPDIVFLFGTSILSEKWLNSFPHRIINLHLGLSPYYRGSATLFWPLANNEPECVGATIHLAEQNVDSGQILARVKPNLTVGDNFYSINYKTILHAINALPNVATRYVSGEIEPISQDLRLGKVFRKADFNENALSSALGMMGVGLTAQQLERIRVSNKCDCLS
jgi:folate-dependent phosphoribosylglycinamide formyltransferase PurN